MCSNSNFAFSIPSIGSSFYKISDFYKIKVRKKSEIFSLTSRRRTKINVSIL